MRSRMPVTGKDDLALTALVRGGASGDGLDVFVHAGAYEPPVFGETGARVAVAGRGRDAAAAKYAPWARMRNRMERMRPPGITELLLTNDGDHILEGSVTNFFVVCLKDEHQRDEPFSVQALAQKFEVQTVPISDGVLPGIIRQIVIEYLFVRTGCAKTLGSRYARCLHLGPSVNFGKRPLLQVA